MPCSDKHLTESRFVKGLRRVSDAGRHNGCGRHWAGVRNPSHEPA